MSPSCICPHCGKKHSYNRFRSIEKVPNRVALFIDGGNLYHAAKSLGCKIDYLLLRGYFVPKGMNLIEAFYYTAYDPSEGFIIKIIDWLKYNGFTVVSKEVKKINNSYIKGNMDVEIVIDMFLNIDNYDIAILFSGDGDFARCVSELQNHNKIVYVVSTEKSNPPLLAMDLKNRADKFIELADIISHIKQQ